MTGGDSAPCARMLVVLSWSLAQIPCRRGTACLRDVGGSPRCGMQAASSANLPYEHHVSFGFGAESGDVEEFPVWPLTDVDTFCTVYKGILEQYREENPNRVGARTQPCFTPLLTGKALEVVPSKKTVLCMSWRKEVMIARSFGGQPMFWMILKSPLLLTKSNVLVRCTKARNNGCCCSRHFSCSWRREKIMSIVDLPALKPHCDSG